MRLIDADAFIEFIKETSEKLEFDKFYVNSGLTVKTVLDAVIADLDGTSRDGFKNAPTIDLKKKGKWTDGMLYYDFEESEWEKVKCSVCENFVTKQIFYHDNKYHYCPYCGAPNLDA